MRKFKIAVWVIIIGLLLLFMFQNQEYFQTTNDFKINFIFVDYQFPGISNAIVFLACFVLGLLVAFIFGLIDRFKNKKTVKQLNTTIHSNQETITKLADELESVKHKPVESKPEIQQTGVPEPEVAKGA